MRRFFLLVLFACAIGMTAHAQSESKSVDIYGGYSYLNARADTFRFLSRDNDNTVNLNGFNVGGTFWFNSSKTLGITGDYTFHTKTEDTGVRSLTVGGGFTTTPGTGTTIISPLPINVTPIVIPAETRLRYNTFQAGPAIRFKKGRFAPFAHALFGATRISSRTEVVSGDPRFSFAGRFENDDTAFSLSVGGGLDVNLTESGRFAVRAGRLEYNYINALSGLSDNQQNLRFSAGVVVRF